MYQKIIFLDALRSAHLGLERTGGTTEAWWEKGRGQDEAPSYWPDVREQAIEPERGRGSAAAEDYSRKRERERLRMLRHVRMRSHGTWCRWLYLCGVLGQQVAGFVVAVGFPVQWGRGSRLLAGRNAQLHHHYTTSRGRWRHSWKSQCILQISVHSNICVLKHIKCITKIWNIRYA